MICRGRAVLLFVAVACASTSANAQVGEVHLGAIASYGVPISYGSGGGIVIGVATGQLTYIGLRWVYHGGSDQLRGPSNDRIEVRSAVQTLAFDLGMQFPIGSFEIIPSISLGAARFSQRSTQIENGRPAAGSQNDTEFLVAPGLSFQARLAGFLVIPELQYILGSEPEFLWPFQHQGPLVSMRIVLPLEVGRIRH